MRNDALKKATGDIILFADADIVMSPATLPIIAEMAQKFSMVSYPAYIFLNDENTFRLLKQKPTDEIPKDFLGLARKSFINRGPFCAMRRECAEGVGGWPELEGWGCEDPIMWKKIQTKYGPAYEMHTSMFHLKHPTKDGFLGASWTRRNAAIEKEYTDAAEKGQEYFSEWLKTHKDRKATKVAFDLDDTLIIPPLATGWTFDAPNYEAIKLYTTLQQQGCYMIIWSQRGDVVAKEWANRLGLGADEIITKTDTRTDEIDICFDDEEVKLAKINVRLPRVNPDAVRPWFDMKPESVAA
jgi:hypothetical protein